MKKTEILRNQAGEQVNELGFTFNEVFTHLHENLRKDRAKLKMIRPENKFLIPNKQ